MRWPVNTPQWLRKRRFEAARRAGRPRLDPTGGPYPYYYLGPKGTECYSVKPDPYNWRSNPYLHGFWSYSYTLKRIFLGWKQVWKERRDR